MKRAKPFIAIIFVFSSLLLFACGNKAHTKEAVIDYGESEIYSKKDMDTAIQLI